MGKSMKNQLLKPYHVEMDTTFLVSLSLFIFAVSGVPDKGLHQLNKNKVNGVCCNSVVFESTGGIVGTDQDHILGNYEYYGEGEWETYVYKQVNGEFWDNYLYFMNDMGIWYVNQYPGQNMGFAMNQNGFKNCPEDLPNDWVWWN